MEKMCSKKTLLRMGLRWKLQPCVRILIRSSGSPSRMLKERPQGTCYFLAQFYLQGTRFLACQKWHLQLILSFLVSQTTLSGKNAPISSYKCALAARKSFSPRWSLGQRISNSCILATGAVTRLDTGPSMAHTPWWTRKPKNCRFWSLSCERNNKFQGSGETRLSTLSRPRTKQWNSRRSGGYR